MKWIIFIGGTLAALIAVVAGVGAALPKNHLATRTSRFRKSCQAVWDVITGPPDWRPSLRGFEKLDPRDGRRAWKEIDNRGQAITYEAIEEIAPKKLVTRIADPKLPFGGAWTLEIAPDAEGCVLTITEAGEIYNPIFRFMARFVFGYTGSIDEYLKALHAKLGDGGQAED